MLCCCCCNYICHPHNSDFHNDNIFSRCILNQQKGTVCLFLISGFFRFCVSNQRSLPVTISYTSGGSLAAI